MLGLLTYGVGVPVQSRSPPAIHGALLFDWHLTTPSPFFDLGGTMPVRRRLVLFAFWLLIPAVLACGAAVFLDYARERQRAEENFLRTVQALAGSMDRELNTIVRRLEVLAASPHLAGGEQEAFWQHARAAVREDGMWVVLTRPDLRQVVNTLRPFGEALPDMDAGTEPGLSVRRVFETGRPNASDMFIGPVTKTLTLAVTVPVFGKPGEKPGGKPGEVRYALSMGLTPKSLQSMVSTTGLPNSWLVGAFDHKMQVVARSAQSEAWVGRVASRDLAEAALAQGAGVIDAVSLEGIPTRVAFARSPTYGWYLAVGMPKAEMVASINRNILVLAAIAAALLAIGLAAAVRTGRQLSQAINTLIPAANLLGDGKPIRHEPTGLHEVDHLATVLDRASHKLRSTEAERQAAEAELTAARHQAAEVLSSITDGFYALDSQWRFTYVNRRAEEVLGKPAADLVGHWFFSAFPQVEGTVVHQNYVAVMNEKQPRQFEFISPILKRWTAFSVYPTAEGGIAVYFRDISAQKAAEAGLIAAKEEAERAAASKSTFLASASHDLRQPMQSLFLFAGALHGHVQSEHGREALENLERGLDVLKSLLDSLLDVSRLDAGVVKPSIEDFPVSLLLDHIAAGYAAVAKSKGLEWTMAACPFHVRTDRVLLGRMIRNMVENAVRYTEHGRIEVSCEASGGRLRIDISDTGVGIPNDQLPRIFEEFHQVGNQERDRTQGLGLGLAIVQRISHLLDHPVSVRSEPGKGSTFSVVVPLGEARVLMERGRITPVPASSGDERFAVVVDDDAIVLLGLQAILKEWGYDVLIAGSTEQALEKLRAASRTPDIIIADYRLRDGRVGTDAILEIRKLFGTPVPGIIVTGETGPECQRDAALHGLGLMHKPVTPRQLNSAMERHMRAAD
ncbi:ATP-binding protein [Azospirillum sp. sgz302134]